MFLHQSHRGRWALFVLSPMDISGKIQLLIRVMRYYHILQYNTIRKGCTPMFTGIVAGRLQLLQVLDEFAWRALASHQSLSEATVPQPDPEWVAWLKGGGALLTVSLPSEHRSGERPLHLGDSIALDGTCYTVVTITEHTFQVVASPETRAKTILNTYQEGALVHYEYPLRLQDPLGGHWVSGHVDMPCPVLAVYPDGNAWRMVFGMPSLEATQLIVPKGSVTLNGVSLTVNQVFLSSSVESNPYQSVMNCLQVHQIPCHGWFDVCLIPHTWSVTNMAQYRPVADFLPEEAPMTLELLCQGAWVNLELDMMGKMIHQRLEAYLTQQGLNRST
jgi:riboflavin synthase alpha subunit